MPRVRLPEESGPGSYRHRDGLSVEQGETVDVDEETAEYLVADWGFEHVDEPESDDVDDAETCTEVKSDGEVCGRELPCPYHSDDEDDVDEDTTEEE